MTEPVRDSDAFAQALQTAYQEVRMHSPQGVPETEERLTAKLERYGITLTSDISRALAFAAVRGRNL